MIIVAHRGASAEAPENTLGAFQLAWAQGADAIECDVRVTADDEIVCIHDARTARVADRDLEVATSRLKTLRELDVGGCGRDAYRGSVIPTLAEVLLTVPPGRLIYIEIKCGPEIVPLLPKILGAAGLEKRQVVFISFHTPVIEALKAWDPEYRAFWLSDLWRSDEGTLMPGVDEVLAMLGRIDADGLSSSFQHANANLIERVQDADFEYHVWTVDETETARAFQQRGTKSLTTNVPGRMRAVFAC